MTLLSHGQVVRAGGTLRNGRFARRGQGSRVMWVWGTLASVVAVVALLVTVVDRLRGSTGDSRSLDLKANSRSDAQYDGGFQGPMSSGGGGGDGGA